MRTRKEIEMQLLKCADCGSSKPNSAGECLCSYDSIEIPVQIEVLLDIRELLLSQQNKHINKSADLPTLLHASCTDNPKIS